MRQRLGSLKPAGWAVLGACLLTLILASVTRADGSIPPQPYRYLHPPPALAPNNNLPQGGSGTISAHAGSSDASDIFSRDGQAGILVPQGGFSLPSTANSIRVSIQPINTPPNLPAFYVADGNAVRFTSTAQRAGKPVSGSGQPASGRGGLVSLTKPATIVLRWPRLPSAVEIYYQGAWRQVCTPQHAVLTPSTFTCPVTELGVFLVVRASNAPAAGKPVPGRGTSPSRFASLARLIPIIIVALVVVVALVLGYILFRSRQAGSRPGSRAGKPGSGSGKPGSGS